jgi:hypothetical protein
MEKSMDEVMPVGPVKKTFLNHVFSTTEEGKAEILNVVQYSLLGVIPIVVLNKVIQRFVPEASTEKSSLELLAEILIQLIVMFCGIVLIHRMITYIPTYSEFKYESLTLTNVILAFLVIVLSIQTKIGIKVNILFDRVMDLWNGTSSSSDESSANGSYKKNVRASQPVSRHSPSAGDHMDSFQADVFPPAPVVSSNKPQAPAQGPVQAVSSDYFGPMAANSVLGGAFGSMF